MSAPLALTGAAQQIVSWTIDVTTDQPFHAWLVLRESPGNGYGIVYDDCSATFGVAQFAHGYEPCSIGRYGDFFTTLEAM